MDFVVYTMANPPSNRGALLSHSSLSPPYGRPRWTALTLTFSKGWAITLYYLIFLWNMDLSWYKFNLLDRLCVRQSPNSKLFAFVNYRWILDLNYLMDNSLDSLPIFRVISLVGLQFHHFWMELSYRILVRSSIESSWAGNQRDLCFHNSVVYV